MLGRVGVIVRDECEVLVDLVELVDKERDVGDAHGEGEEREKRDNKAHERHLARTSATHEPLEADDHGHDAEDDLKRKERGKRVEAARTINQH